MYHEVINLLLIIANFICIIIVTKPFDYYITKKQKKYYKLLRVIGYIICLPIITAAEMTLRWAFYDILLVNIAFVLIIALFYKLNLKQMSGMALATLALCAISFDLIDASMFYNKLDRYGLVVLLIFGLVIISIILEIIKICTLRQISNIKKSEIIIFVGVPIVSAIMVAILLLNYHDLILIIMGGLVLLIINIFTFYLLDRIVQMNFNKIKVMMIEEKNDAIKNQMKVYVDSSSKISSIRHDLKNHIFAMEKLLENQKYDKLQIYLENLDDTMKLKDRFVNTGNLIIDSIINLKCKTISDLVNKEMQINLAIPSDIRINETDICVILGNLFDNAIEALSKCVSDKEFLLDIKEKSNLLFIKMTNSFNGEVEKEASAIKSTKADKFAHGFGLRNIENVLEKYHGKMKITYDDCYFTVEIIMYLE